MTVQRVEITQVRDDQALLKIPRHTDDRIYPVAIGLCVVRHTHPALGVQVVDFSDSHRRNPRIMKNVKNRRPEWFERKIPSVRCPCVRAAHADKGPSDDPTDGMFPHADLFARLPADLIQPL